jgi:hypothetical protein
MRFRRLGSRVRWLVGVSSGGLAALVGYACSNTTAHPGPVQEGDGSVGTSSSGGSSSGGSSSGGSSSGDGASPTDGRATDSSGDGSSSGCTTLTQGNLLGTTVLAGAWPTPTGGAIPLGTFALNERDYYSGSGDGFDGHSVSGTILVASATSMSVLHTEVAGDGGAPVTTGGDFTYTTSGDVVTQVSTCPSSGQVTNVKYTVSGTDLWLFPTQGVVEIYKKK